jgi:hypothetical protein
MKLSSTSCWKLAKVSTEEARMWGEDSLPPGGGPLSCCSGADIEAKVKVEVMNLRILLAEGARFETTDTPETIDLDLLLSFQSQSFTKARGR